MDKTLFTILRHVYCPYMVTGRRSLIIAVPGMWRAWQRELLEPLAKALEAEPQLYRVDLTSNFGTNGSPFDLLLFVDLKGSSDVEEGARVLLEHRMQSTWGTVLDSLQKET